MATVRESLQQAAQSIAARDAEVLLAHLLGCERSFLLAHPEHVVVNAAFRKLVARRAAGEPLQYITGQQEFYGLMLRVSPAVLIPRPETELLVEQVLLWAAQQDAALALAMADVGTGSGAIAVALATHLGGASFVATDTSAAALEVARANAEAFGVNDRVRFVEADLLPLDCRAAAFDAVISNPPYVPAGDAATMQREVVDHEPHSALFAGSDGMEVYRALVPLAMQALKPDGLLALEFGFGQRDAMRELLAAWSDVRFIDDYAGIPRVVLATKPA